MGMVETERLTPQDQNPGGQLHIGCERKRSCQGKEKQEENRMVEWP